MSEVEYERAGTVGVVTLNAPDRRNALTSDMAKRFSDVIDAAEQTPDLTALVVRGAGNGFCAGATLALLGEAGTDPASDTARAEITAVYQAFFRLGAARVPTVAAVRGAAVGAGLNLALAADLRVVGPSTRLISGFSRIGLHPGGGHIALLTRAAGRSTAAAMVLFGQQIHGADAVDRGLAWSCVPDDQVDDAAVALAAAVPADQALMAATIESFRLITGPPETTWPAASEIERSAQIWSMRRRTAHQS